MIKKKQFSNITTFKNRVWRKLSTSNKYSGSYAEQLDICQSDKITVVNEAKMIYQLCLHICDKQLPIYGIYIFLH